MYVTWKLMVINLCVYYLTVVLNVVLIISYSVSDNVSTKKDMNDVIWQEIITSMYYVINVNDYSERDDCSVDSNIII